VCVCVCVFTQTGRKGQSRCSHRLSLCVSETEMGRRALLIFEKNDDRAEPSRLCELREGETLTSNSEDEAFM
jgi:hypothetical protein